jgi:multidrug efflux system membrane fusion protein
MSLLLLALAALSAVGVVGCGKGEDAAATPSELPVVPVSQPVQREVTDYVDFTGRTDAVNSVGVRARVTGYVVTSPFREGAEVKKDDLLFEIDPRPYQAQLDQAQAQVALNEASLKLAQVTYDRARSLVTTGAVTQQEVDQDKAAVDEAKARINASQAAVKVNKLNLEFCRVTSPIDGMVSRYYQTEGNLVNQDQTLLTTVVSLDPIYAYFDMDEPTLQRINKAINEGKIQLPEKGSQVPILLGLQVETGYPHTGTFNFLNNVVNPATGSIAVRGRFDNPKPPHGTRLLRPGMFVRIRLPIGTPHSARLVVDRALGSDQGLKFVYVLDKDNKVQYRRVTTGPLQADGLRVIEDGLQPDDWVVVGNLQQVRPRMEVKPDRIAMPTPGKTLQTAPVGPQPPPPGEAPKDKGQRAKD